MFSSTCIILNFQQTLTYCFNQRTRVKLKWVKKTCEVLYEQSCSLYFSLVDLIIVLLSQWWATFFGLRHPFWLCQNFWYFFHFSHIFLGKLNIFQGFSKKRSLNRSFWLFSKIFGTPLSLRIDTLGCRNTQVAHHCSKSCWRFVCSNCVLIFSLGCAANGKHARLPSLLTTFSDHFNKQHPHI